MTRSRPRTCRTEADIEAVLRIISIWIAGTKRIAGGGLAAGTKPPTRLEAASPLKIAALSALESAAGTVQFQNKSGL
jgi:hypothetical protein